MTEGHRMTLAEQVTLIGTNAGLSPSVSLDNICCFRSLWIDYALYGMYDEEAILRELALDRRGCPGFFRYKQGWKPNEHRDLFLKAEEFRQKIFFAVLGTLLTATGALLTLVITWVIKK